KTEKLDTAAAALAALVKDRAATEEPLLKEEATTFLCKEQNLTQKAARALLTERDGRTWRIQKLEKRKGHPHAVLPCVYSCPTTKITDNGNPHKTGTGEEDVSVEVGKSSDGNGSSQKTASNVDSRNDLFPSPGSAKTTETPAQKSP